MFFQKRKKTIIATESSNSEIKQTENTILVENNVCSVIFNELTITEKNVNWTIDEKGTNEFLNNPEEKNLLEKNKIKSPDFHIYEWLCLNGEYVEKNQPILLIQKGNPELFK